MPSPSQPYPQHLTTPMVVTGQVWNLPAVTATTFEPKPITSTGVDGGSVPELTGRVVPPTLDGSTDGDRAWRLTEVASAVYSHLTCFKQARWEY